MERRRFMRLSGAAACPCSIALAGCIAGPSGDPGGNTTETETPELTPESDDTPETETPEGDEFEGDEPIEHDGRPITDYDLEVTAERRNGHVFWIDLDGVMYGRSGPRLLRSEDWWESHEVIYSFANQREGYNSNIIQSVMVTDAGQILCGVGGRGDEFKETGRIELLDEDLEGSTTVYEFEYGRTTASFGHAVYEEIVVIDSYGRSDFENDRHPDEVTLSTDGGESFEQVLRAEFQTADAANHHIYDVEYDPFAERIWVTVGDGGNAQIYWSDDLGDSWDHLDEYGIREQPTQVAAFRNNVVFGTDGNPDGIMRFPREDPSEAPESIDDMGRGHVTIHDDEHNHEMRMYARRRWHVREDDGRELCIIPFGYSPMHPDARESVVLASVDGDAWFELYRVDDREKLLTNVMRPLSRDGDLRTLISDSARNDGFQIDATIPEFWKRE
jgi:hypothetical protein